MKMFVKNILAAAALIAVIGANTVDCAKVATAAAGGFGEDSNKNFNNNENLINKKNGKKRKKNDLESTMTTIAELEQELDIADGDLVTLLSIKENKTRLGSKARGKLKPGSLVNRVIATIIWQESQNNEFEKDFDMYYEEKQAENKKRKMTLPVESKKQEEIQSLVLTEKGHIILDQLYYEKQQKEQELRKNLSYAWLKFVRDQERLKHLQVVIAKEEDKKQEQKQESERDRLIRMFTRSFNNEFLLFHNVDKTDEDFVKIVKEFRTVCIPNVVDYFLKKYASVNENNYSMLFDGLQLAYLKFEKYCFDKIKENKENELKKESEKKNEQKPENKPEQKPENKPEQKPENKPEQKPEQENQPSFFENLAHAFMNFFSYDLFGG